MSLHTIQPETTILSEIRKRGIAYIVTMVNHYRFKIEGNKIFGRYTRDTPWLPINWPFIEEYGQLVKRPDGKDFEDWMIES